ncbi:MAG TPA: Ku protein [Thermoanaerobaculia bacterium]|nr:Ku protein [Thermoanaerobaculia bacterium]
MAPRSIANATITFGLVTVPVKLFAASQSSESVSFNLLHDKCGSRLKQFYRCIDEEEEVTRDAMVKGYEFSKGQYVKISEEELKALEQRSTQEIVVNEFVPSDAIDPVFFDRAYYLGPDKGGDRAYRLLSEAMKHTEKWAVGMYTARGREYLVALRPVEGGLVMQQLHYGHEVRSFSELDLPSGEIKEQELKLAVMLAEQITSDHFDPEAYQDQSHEKLRSLIQRKVQGEDILTMKAEPQKSQVIDLMEALKASLAGGKRPAAAEVRKPARRSPRPAAAAAAPKERASASRGRRK